MADYPKEMAKAGQTRLARNKADDVRLTFAGFKPVETKPEPSAPASVSEDSAVPELNEAEMAEQPEAKDAEVVDTTTARKR